MASVGAFALACNVFQAALWCYEAGHAVYQIYKDGTSPANRSLEDLTQHLTTALARLNDIKNAASPTEHDKKLKEVADMCLRIGNDLQGKLTKMTNSSTDGKRERLQKAVRAVWEKESIQELHNSLRDVQQVLNTVGMIHTVNTR